MVLSGAGKGADPQIITSRRIERRTAAFGAGVAKLDHRLLIMLDLEKVLCTNQIGALDELVRAEAG